MRRKTAILITALVLIVAVGAPAVFANEGINSDPANYIKSMFDAMRNWTSDALEKGQITQSEAKRWNKHFDAMEKFHGENGFSSHCGGNAGQETPDGQNQSFESKPMAMMGGYRNSLL